jgi:polysaccharide pyruvyl transferase WcaK-like protein
MIYHVYANRSNIGDWLSAKGIQSLLAPLEVVECLCDKPFVGRTMRLLSGATPSDLIIIGGGGLLMDYFEPFWRRFGSVSRKVPFCIWGVGVCDFKTGKSLINKSLIEKIVKESRLCVVRDYLTFEYLSACDIPEPVPCPSVCVIRPPAVLGRDLLHVVNYTTVGVRGYEAMCALARDFAGKTGCVYRETNNRITKDSETELAQVMVKYEKSNLVLSSGLHGCVIGAAMGLKVLAVSGDRKIDAFMRTVGLRDWVVNPDEIEFICERLQDLERQVNPGAAIKEIRVKNQAVANQIKEIAAQARLN